MFYNALFQDLENAMAEQLDDLLVADNVLPARASHIEGDSGFGMRMLITVRDKPRVNFKLEVYPNETEEPHFKVVYQNCTCRFKISDCSPMKAEAQKGIPPQIKKIQKQIKTVWAANKETIIAAWNASRPSDQHHGHQKIR